MSAPLPRRLPRPQFLKPNEVAKVLRVSTMTIYREIENGRLPAVRVGRSIRVPHASLDEYLRDMEVGRDDEIGDEA